MEFVRGDWTELSKKFQLALLSHALKIPQFAEQEFLLFHVTPARLAEKLEYLYHCQLYAYEHA